MPMLSEPDATNPRAAGVRVIPILQLVVAANGPTAQVVVAGSNAYPPAGRSSEVIAIGIEGASSLFVRVMIWTALGSLTATHPNPKLDALTQVGLIPAPDKATVCGLLPASVVIVSEPAGTVLMASGVSVSAMVQLLPAANEPGLAHVVDGSIAYPPAGTVIELIASGLS